MTFADRVEAEVVGLHRFLQAWFTAALPRTPGAFARLSDAWQDPFTLIAPDNERLSATDLLATTMSQHGEFPALTIHIRRLRVSVHRDASVAIALYEEWHVEPGHPPDVRLCSATFIEDAARPNAAHWVHVHESRLDAPPA